MSGAARALLFWRHLALAAAVAGLLASRPLEAPPAWPAAAGAALVLLALTRPGEPRWSGAWSWLGLLVCAAALAGLGAGDLRLAAIAARAAPGEAGDRVVAIGHVAALPRSVSGELRFPLDTADGRLLVVGRADPAPAIGDRLRVSGRLADPEQWRRDELLRAGATHELRTTEIKPLPGGRGGPGALLDRARTRAEQAVAEGLDDEQSALARGFVLGQDESIGEPVREQFRRSGLAHLLAVSGQNVMLLAILAGVLLALLGVGPRERLIAIVALIACYVPLAGAGPSIQRAGVMGAAGILAGLAGRSRDRAYLPLLAAAATLLLNPHSADDIGWQLSFAAVIGISLWAPRLRDLLADRLSGTPIPARLAAPLAEGAGLTIAATLATAPLMALHFEAISLASLPANLLVLPAVAPVMWLGMLAAIGGQLPVPDEALGAIGTLEGPLLDYIGAVAELFARPSGAVIELSAPAPLEVAALYLGLLGGMAALLAAARRRRGQRLVPALGLLLALGVIVSTGAAALDRGPAIPEPAPGALRIAALDIGQGDAILLHGNSVPAVLIDTGPPGAGLARALGRRGIDRLAALVISHDQLDHSGALDELLAAVAVERILLSRPAPSVDGPAAAAGIPVELLAAGDSARLGRLRLDVLSPAPGAAPAPDPNEGSLVLRARYAGWSTLLTGDAEAEAVPLQPGPLDVLKLAHHGSADAGLGPLLDRSRPAVALVSVGADNPHGHPTAETLAALAERGVCALRTDRDGDVWVDQARGSLTIGSERQPAGDPGCAGRLAAPVPRHRRSTLIGARGRRLAQARLPDRRRRRRQARRGRLATALTGGAGGRRRLTRGVRRLRHRRSRRRRGDRLDAGDVAYE